MAFLFWWLFFPCLASSSNILPLLPPHTQELRLSYDGHWISQGEKMSRNDTVLPPQISTAGLPCPHRFIIFCIDIDVVLESNATVILHWYQPDMTTNCSNSHLSPKHEIAAVSSSKSAAYIGPQPPAGASHRYVFLAFQQPDHYVFPDCFDHIFPKTVEARAGFDIQLFSRVAGLPPPVAGNYIVVGSDELTTTTTATQSVTTTSMRDVRCTGVNGGHIGQQVIM
ncbi:hypothetical protein ASPZODRAFT_25932 [Penicilliopsis zonata CBS 506.65]|uniref:Phosphatidylethanolamine-binding protein n=1 Tax=Penicilliopsis zonata CBS 506.65 TaxID=1073090 RepID=A0A1L9SFV5_9EURO|nr:hypothetical protein ASPZODRAFT_25932 [Penicilliopsis zonata CBS 506.65]OJJ46041.1 hypothetical protein ASPZODRAFT_25932 [Penicilliopsis zonata CBS 506.65]